MKYRIASKKNLSQYLHIALTSVSTVRIVEYRLNFIFLVSLHWVKAGKRNRKKNVDFSYRSTLDKIPCSKVCLEKLTVVN
jgi:hypothetical protein